MARTGKYLDTIESVFGKGSVTSGYRSQAEQDALVAAQKTRATRSSHTYDDGYDIGIGSAKSEAEIRSRAAAKGLTVGKVIRETGQGQNQGTGPHWHIELGDKKVANSNSNSNVTSTSNPTAYLAGLESALGPEKMASENVTQNSDKIFNSDPELARRGQAVETQLTHQGQQIDVLGQAMQAAHAAQTGALAQQVGETRDVSNEIVRGTRELKEKVTPVFQARGRVADQLDKLATMNPLERGLRGIFDLNYDKKYLEGQLDQFDRTLKARSDDFNYLNTLHEKALGEVDRRFKLDTAQPGLLQEQANEDLGLVGMRLTQTMGMLDSLKGNISTQTQMISAKAMAREDMMGRLDIPTLSNLAAGAEQNGGVINYNGAEFSGHELRGRVQAEELNQYNIKAARQAAISGDIQFQEQAATQLARGLTRGQLEAAINNGGVYQGVKIPQDTLTSLYGSAVNRDKIKAEAAATNLPTSVAYQAAADSMHQAVGLSRRARGLFGSQSMAGGNAYLERAGQLARDLATAGDTNQPPEVITALTQKVAKNSADFAEFVDSKILLQTGGDKRAAGYLKGFVYGSQLSPGTAAEAMTYFAVKGSLPEGVALSPESKQVFQRAQSLVKAARDKYNGKKVSEQQILSEVTPLLTEAAGQIMGQARFDKLYGDLPTVAKSAGSPFGRFDRQKWANIRAASQNDAAQAIAKSVNADPSDVLKIMRGGKPLGQNEDDKKLFDAVMANQSKYNAIELDSMSKLLDLETPVVPGKNNSSALSEFLGSAQFTQGIRTYGQSLSSESMGEYLANPLQAGATEMVFNKTREDLNDTIASQQTSLREIARNPGSSEIFRPMSRTGMILTSIPGVGAAGNKALQPFVTDFFNKYLKANLSNGIESPNARFMREDAAMRDALQSQQFEDKQLETYRKLALKNWDEHATAQQGFITRLVDSLFGSIM